MPASVHTEEQKRSAVEHAHRLMKEEGLSQNKACARAGEALDPPTAGKTVVRWAELFEDIDLSNEVMAQRYKIEEATKANTTFSLSRRKKLTDYQGIIIEELTFSFMAWMAAEPSEKPFSMTPEELVKVMKDLGVATKNLHELRLDIEKREEELGIIDGDSRSPDTSDLESGMALLAQAEG